VDGKKLQFIATVLFVMCSLIIWIAPSAGAQKPAVETTISQTAPDESSAGKPPLPRQEYPDMRFSGRFKTAGSVSWPDADSIFEPVGTGVFYDGSADLRLINETFFSDRLFFEAHYEAILAGGDTRRKSIELETVFPGFPENLFGTRLNDDRRLMDLTDTLRDKDSYRVVQRLDRLDLGMIASWGSLRLGRQAVTWGNGLIFNPMDLFNPFAPTEVDRDYKPGDDLVAAQINLPRSTDLQLLCVAHRNPETHDAGFNESSLGGKAHFSRGTTELDIMAARHYEDYVLGFGSRGYLADAAWRLDATWTALSDPAQESPDGYLSLVANMDYSWVLWDKNFYGLVEFYFNGLGDNDYEDAIANPDIVERLARGELFVLGRSYLSASVQIELHPLLQFYLTAINNINDPSGILQPRLQWDLSQDLQMTLGANLYYGAPDTEYGGFKLPGTSIRTRPADGVYLWFTYYF